MPKSRKKSLPAPAPEPAVHDLVAVSWEDAAFDLDKDPGTLIMTTVGYIVRHDEQVIVVAGESSAAGDYFRSHTAIPASLIRSICRLLPAKST